MEDIRSTKAAAALFAAMLAFAPQCLAEEPGDDNIGFVQVRPPKPEPKPGASEPEEDPSQFGFVRVPGVVIPEKQEGRKQGEGTDKLASELSKISKLHKERRFKEAFAEMTALRQRYPEVPSLYSWEAIYAELAGEHNESLSLWDNYGMVFPLDKHGAEEMFYKARAYIALKSPERAAELIAEGAKRESAFSGAVKEKRIISLAFSFLAEKAKGDRSEQDVERLWSALAPEERMHLDNFYGFDLSELWLWRGDLFGQAKWLEKYIETEKENDTEEAIKNARDAARLLYSREQR